MTIYQIVNLLLAASLPIVVLIVAGRHCVSAFRSLRVKRFKFALFSILGIAGILFLFAGVVIVWFGYGVGHSRKDIWTDLILLTVSAVPVYGGGYGLWRLARFIDTRPSAGAA